MEKQKIVVLGGCGHVGLPLAIHLAIVGYESVVVDINQSAVGKVNGGEYPFVESRGDRYLAVALAQGFRATTNIEEMKNANVIVIITGMDVDTYGNADFKLVSEHLKLAVMNSPANALILLRSTLAPGTMALLVEQMNHLTSRQDAVERLAYCPERIAEAMAFEEAATLPQILSAFSDIAFQKAWEIFSKLCSKGIRLSPLEAEYAKLVTNTWRYSEFALANTLYSQLENHGVSFHRIFEALRYEYPRAKGFKSPGFACGPCLLEDTKMLTNGGITALGTFAIAANEGLPKVAVDMLAQALATMARNDPTLPTTHPTQPTLLFSGKTIGILGMTFKADVDDLRQSLSVKIKKLLELQGAIVYYHDPFLSMGENNVSLDELFTRCDGFILGTPHSCYTATNNSNSNSSSNISNKIDWEKYGNVIQVVGGAVAATSVVDNEQNNKKKPLVDVWGVLFRNNNSNSNQNGSGVLEILEGNPSGGNHLAKGRPTILITGSTGFIAGYVIRELLAHGYHIIGLDNFSKYGKVVRDYDQDPHYEFYDVDVKDVTLMKNLAMKCDYVLACAAMIGGISYFHEFAYDLIAENERITSSTFDAAIHAYKYGHLKKIVVLSSSMVFECATSFPFKETDLATCPPPQSTYGFQKLACEYYAKGAYEQYGLPYTIVRPFNCVGLGEPRAKNSSEVQSGNIRIAMSHVVPDLIQKVVRGQDPLHILGSGQQIRQYTYGGDLAKGIRLCIEHSNALNNDFNISTEKSTSVLELAELIWNKFYAGKKVFNYVCDDPFKYDVQSRIPDCIKARELLGFRATTTLDEILDEMLPRIQQQIEMGKL